MGARAGYVAALALTAVVVGVPGAAGYRELVPVGAPVAAATDCTSLVLHANGGGRVTHAYAACKAAGIVAMAVDAEGSMRAERTLPPRGSLAATTLLSIDAAANTLYAVHEDAAGAVKIERLENIGDAGGARQEHLRRGALSRANPTAARDCGAAAHVSSHVYLCCGGVQLVYYSTGGAAVAYAGATLIPQGCASLLADPSRGQLVVGTQRGVALYSVARLPPMEAAFGALAAPAAALAAADDWIYVASSPGIHMYDASYPGALTGVDACCLRGRGLPSNPLYTALAAEGGAVTAVGAAASAPTTFMAVIDVTDRVAGGVVESTRATAGRGAPQGVVAAGGRIYAVFEGGPAVALRLNESGSAGGEWVDPVATADSARGVARWLALAGASLSTMGVGAGGLPGMRFVLASQTCKERVAVVNGAPPPVPLHITQYAIGGDYALGMLTMNILIAGFVSLVGWGAHMCRQFGRERHQQQHRSGSGGSDASCCACHALDTAGHFSFPSPCLSAFLMIYQGCAYATWLLVVHPEIDTDRVVGAVAMLAIVITVPLFTFSKVREGVALTMYLPDRNPAPWKTHLLGPGEYVNLERDDPRVNPYAPVVLPYHEAVVAFTCLESVICCGVALLAALDPRTHCGWAKTVEAVLSAMLIAANLKVVIYVKTYDRVIAVLSNVFQFAGHAAAAYAAHAGDASWEDVIGFNYLLAALVICVKGVLDVVSAVATHFLRRRPLLQEEAYCHVAHYTMGDGSQAGDPSGDANDGKPQHLEAPGREQMTGAASRSHATTLAIHIPPAIPVRLAPHERAAARKEALLAAAARARAAFVHVAPEFENCSLEGEALSAHAGAMSPKSDASGRLQCVDDTGAPPATPRRSAPLLDRQRDHHASPQRPQRRGPPSPREAAARGAPDVCSPRRKSRRSLKRDASPLSMSASALRREAPLAASSILGGSSGPAGNGSTLIDLTACPSGFGSDAASMPRFAPASHVPCTPSSYSGISDGERAETIEATTPGDHALCVSHQGSGSIGGQRGTTGTPGGAGDKRLSSVGLWESLGATPPQTSSALRSATSAGVAAGSSAAAGSMRKHPLLDMRRSPPPGGGAGAGGRGKAARPRTPRRSPSAAGMGLQP